MNSVVVGIGGALPKKCVTNFDFPEELNTSDDWITQRTGIKQRYIAENETTASLATEAARNAIKNSGISAENIDLIIVATVTGDYSFPSVATIVQRELGITGKCAAFDVSAACSGFIYAMNLADLYIKSGKSKCALIIGADTFSKILDWRDRSTCVLFGDGAGAMILRAEKTNIGIQYTKIYSCSSGEYIDYLRTTGGISTTQSAGVLQMDGQEVFRFAVEKFNESLQELLSDNNISIDDIDLIVPHQANIRIIGKLINSAKIDRNKVLITVDKHANTSAATIPLALDTVRDTVFSKRNVVFLSVGAGFTWGSALVRFS
jgi:3-oxoacyl-[acyl-carrier-protein] synthase-3